MVVMWMNEVANSSSPRQAREKIGKHFLTSVEKHSLLMCNCYLEGGKYAPYSQTFQRE